MIELTKYMRTLSFVMPAFVFVAALGHVWANGFINRHIVWGIFVFSFSCMLARFLYKRSKDEEAAFGTVRVKPDDDEGEKLLLDSAAVIFAIFCMTFTLVMPFFKK